MSHFVLHLPQQRPWMRWIVAAAVIFMVHAAAIVLAVVDFTHAPKSPPIIPAIAVSLAPVQASSPSQQDQDVAVGPAMQQTDAVPQEQPKEEDKPEEQAPEWYKDPANLPLAKDIARYVFIALVLAFLWFRFVRPLLKPAIKKFDEAVAIPPEPEPEEPEPEPEPDPEEEARIQREAEEHQKVQVYKSNLEMAKDMAKNDPRIVANVIKEWLGTE